MMMQLKLQQTILDHNLATMTSSRHRAAISASTSTTDANAGIVSPYFSASAPLGKRSRKATAAAAVFTTFVSGAGAALLPAPTGGSFTSSSHPICESSNTPSKRKASVVSPSPVPKKTARKKEKSCVTTSFEPLWSNRFTSDPVPVHTLILGTHPSVASLSHQQYYAYSMNAFWWIAGDCLGFRRASGISPSTGKPYKFAEDLRYRDEGHIIPYEEQIEKLAMTGFAMWDVIASCQRPGSLDQDIRNETPNDIRGFCQQHSKTLRRIVFSNGGTGSALFVKHFREWLESGELRTLENHDASEKAFGKAIHKGEQKRKKNDKKDRGMKNERCITIISALPVSPAAARYTYAEKRDFWEEFVYGPGLRDFETNQQAN